MATGQDYTGIYCKTKTRIRLKALAWISRMSLSDYLTYISERESITQDPQQLREAIEKVTAGPKDGD